MTAALLVAGWFVCGIAGVWLDNAIYKEQPVYRDVKPMAVWCAIIGPGILMVSLVMAVVVAVTQMDGGQ